MSSTGSDRVRYSTVPWLRDVSDLRPYGAPETTVELCHGRDITHGLRIVAPFGPGTDAMLAVHAVRDSGVITLAITNVIAYDLVPVEPAQSNPRRHLDEGE